MAVEQLNGQGPQVRPPGPGADHRPIRVLVVEGQPLSRLGILSVLRSAAGVEILGEVAEDQEALKQGAALRPDVVLVDRMIPGRTGVAATSTIKDKYPDAHILIVCGDDSDRDGHMADLGTGAHILTEATPANLAHAVRAACNGSGHLDVVRQATDRLAASPQTRAVTSRGRPDGLTERELSVLSGVTAGLSDKEIAATLFVTEATIKTHLKILYRRLNLRNRAHAAVVAIERGWVPSPRR